MFRKKCNFAVDLQLEVDSEKLDFRTVYKEGMYGGNRQINQRTGAQRKAFVLKKIPAIPVEYVQEAVIATIGLQQDPVRGFLSENINMGKGKILVF